MRRNLDCVLVGMALGALVAPAEASARRCEKEGLGAVISDDKAPPGKYFAYLEAARSPDRSAIKGAPGLFKTWLAPDITIKSKSELTRTGEISNEAPWVIKVNFGQLASPAPRGLTLDLSSGSFKHALPLDSWSLGGGSIYGMISDDSLPRVGEYEVQLPRAKFVALARQLSANPSTLSLRVNGRPFASVVIPAIGNERRTAQLAWLKKAAPAFPGRCTY